MKSFSYIRPGPSPEGASTRPSSFDSVDATDLALHARTMGAIISRRNRLSESQIDQILAHQRKNGIRFGESAVALGLASTEDVLRALSQQFEYPYSTLSPGTGNPELVMFEKPFGEQAESFRELRSQLMQGVLGPEEPRRCLAVVSPDVGDGKTFVAANLAVAFSQLGVNTLLVDLDMRTPRQHRVFDVENVSGLSNMLSGRSEANVIRTVKNHPTLFVLPVGNIPPNPLELVQRPGLGLLIHELMTKFDYVIVDTPAASHGADFRVVATKCGAALAVGRGGKSRLRSMQNLISGLGRSPVSMAGVVINEH